MAPSYRALWRQDKSLDFLTAARRLASQTCVCPIVSLECLWDQDEKFLNSLYRGYSNKKPEYLVYQEEGMDEAFRVVSDVAGER